MRNTIVRWGLVLGVLGGAACSAWKQVEVSPTALATGPAKVRVTRADGGRVVLDSPRIVGDSLYGQGGGREMVLPLSGVSRMATQEPAGEKNAAGLTFVAAGLATVLGWLVYFAIAP
jgi:hypothetical protein